MSSKAIKCGVLISDGKVYENITIGIKDKYFVDFIKEDKRIEWKEILDLSEYTILPGLIDAHIHFGPDDAGHKYARLFEDANKKLIKAVVDAKNLLRAGFTSARVVGSERALALRDCIDSGEIEGPRLICSGKGITTIGCAEVNRGYNLPLDIIDKYADMTRIACGVEECRRIVREEYWHGVNFIKLFVNGEYLESNFSEAEIETVIEEARRLGLKVAVHSNGGELLRCAVKAGCHTIEHGVFLEEKDCLLMKENGVIFVPTPAFPYIITNRGKDFGVPEETIAPQKEILEQALESIRLAREIGTEIATGSDYGIRAFNRHGTKNINSILLLVKAGFSPLEAITSATKIASKALGLEDKIGTIVSGKYADLIAVTGDPLSNVEKLKDISLVIKEGEIVHNLLPEGIYKKAN
jgi:imidazolonepropionase-like amidohydrolase